MTSPVGSTLVLYDNARFYSTTLGTFMSADTLTVDGLNRYAYVRGNPLRYNDPSGHGVTGGGGLNEGYCPATKPTCFGDGGGPVGGTGKPAPVRLSRVPAAPWKEPFY